MKKEIKRMMTGLAGILIFSIPLSASALCLRECVTDQSRGTLGSSGDFANNTQQNQADQRTGSHNFGDTSTNVMGDMNIQVGHEHVDIKGMENSTNSMIDASINSTIILGNVKQ